MAKLRATDWRYWAGAPDARLWVMALFLAAVFLLGGSAREDVAGLVVLRPLAVVVAAYALWVASPGELSSARLGLIGLGGVAIIILLQLVPLPPGWWAALPGRAPYVTAANEAGLGRVWHPISLSPARSLNALLALLVPLGGIMGFAMLAPRHRDWAVFGMLAGLLASAVLGGFQLLAPSNSGLYLYEISSFGSPSGVFANRNHFAVSLAVAIALLAWWAAGVRPRDPQRHAKWVGVAVVQLGLLGLIVTGQSRAGLITGGIAAGFAAWSLWRQLTAPAAGLLRRDLRMILIILGAALVVIVAASWLAGPQSAVVRVTRGDQIEDLRVRVFPVLRALMWTYFPFGSGFGTFVPAFQQVEPDALLNPTYLNAAHNDWIQLIIEGGAFGMGIAGAALVSIGRLIIRLFDQGQNRARERQVFLEATLVVFVILMIASAVDYPLRTPIMATFALIMMVHCRETRLPKVAVVRQIP